MATISFSDSAPDDVKDSVHFTFGATEFDLKPGSSREESDPAVIASAEAHPWLKVEDKTSTETKTPEQVAEEVANSDDPHVNPAADHLSDRASEEVVEAARQRNAEITGIPVEDAESPAEEPAPKPAPVAPPVAVPARPNQAEGARS